MSPTTDLVVGAVAYSPNVVPIWEGMRDYFGGAPVGMDVVLFTNYERQVEFLLDGRIDIAWNTNLAYCRTMRRTQGRARALAMRDTDATFRTVFVSRRGAGFSGPSDLAGRRIALGSRDSGQARILALHYLAEAGIGDTEAEFVPFDSDVGKHGDTGRSELDAIRAVLDDVADAAPLGINTWRALQDEDIGLEAFWETEEYCHCMFTALESTDPSATEAWVRHLLAMDWDDPVHREILELEGLRRWIRPRLDGYASLYEAMDAQGIGDTW